jgi:RHS repeat-associated protein
VPQITDRGFTGHEHLDAFGLINMLSAAKSREQSEAGNGRMYDPVLGRFLGVDPVIQSPDFSQSFNGYSYCFNNPLNLSDPSGCESYYIDNSYGQNTQVIQLFISSLIGSNYSLTGLDLSSFEYFSESDIAKIRNPIVELLIDQNGGIDNLDKDQINDILKAGVSAALRFLTHDIPDAAMLFGDFDIFIGLNLTGTAGIVAMFKGNDAGKIRVFNGSVEGIGYDVSIGIGTANIYYSGDQNKLLLRDFEGCAFQLSLGYVVAEVGIMVSTKLEKGGYLIGFVGGINFSFPPFSVSAQKTIIKFDY